MNPYSLQQVSMAGRLFYLICLIIFLPCSALAQRNGIVVAGSFITATDGSTSWLSPSGDFAFGFQPTQAQDLFVLSIWYDKLPNKTIVWFANQAPGVPRGSRVVLTAERGLVLTDTGGTELWSSSQSIAGPVAYGVMNDTGNFVLVQSDSSSSWESFSYPADTLLPTQMLESGGVIYSRVSQTNFSKGRFQLRLLRDGNLVLNTRNIPTDYAYKAYYISGTYDPNNSSNSGYRFIFDETGYMFVLRSNGQRAELSPKGVLATSEYYLRSTLDVDGIFALYTHPKNFTGNPGWMLRWSEPDNICLFIAGEGSGTCGLNSVCRLDDNRRPICECPRGYTMFDPSDPYSSCNPSYSQMCGENGSTSAGGLYDLVELRDTDWPESDYERLTPASEESCRVSCLNDCFCAVAIYRGSDCWKKKLPLSNGRNDISVNGKAFLKFQKGGLPPVIRREEKKDCRSLILVGSALLASSLFVNFVSIGAACLGFFLIYRKKVVKPQGGGSAVETNLLCFTYKELAEATDGFKEELGRGAFAIVYKGVISANAREIVAVKKLDRMFQNGEREFEAEVKAIARTHHKNLVRLLGYCDEGQHRLLVYEYMSNGTLASFLFGDIKPSWEQRTHIALGIAKGLSYLHEECSTQIIHCDIKPQNILLDDYFNARISDFGLAKLLMINQSRTNTGIRGTKGYVAPEWFRNSLITAKVDVYSFGVLLLEIISCRRSLEDLKTGEEDRAILTDWAWDCYQEKRLDVFVEYDEEALGNKQQLETFLMTGIWCIQEKQSLRPTMRKIIQMLEGVIEVSDPPCPSPFVVSSVCHQAGYPDA